MASNKTGARPHKQKERGTLTVPPPLVKTTLAAGDFQLHHVAGATHFHNSLVRDRKTWDIERRRVGIFSPVRLKKADADKALKAALSALEGGES